MRQLRLARILMEAEVLRLRHQARRSGFRLVFAIFAAAFLLAAIAFGHAAVWYFLRVYLAPNYVALILAAADGAAAAGLGLLAMRSAPDPVEREALALRQVALDEITGSFTVASLAVRLLTVLLKH